MKRNTFIYKLKWLSIICVTMFFFWGNALEVNATEPVVVVIDPGHGGENLGAEYADYTEKDMTKIVAGAMKEELEKYEGITVYLTSEDDRDMSLEERAKFAAEKDADFLYCLHFNMSGEHTLFGSECWVSAFGEFYSKGYSFSKIEMEMLEEKGLYSRGIKTRLGKKGTDYYGIIKWSTSLGIPSVIIEHCHLDNENDQPFYDHDEKLKEFGRLDATAVAKYFGLCSESLGKDFSEYTKTNVPVPTEVVKPDSTEPEISNIEFVSQDDKTYEATFRLTGHDTDSGMQYYAYSTNGGETFSPLQKWTNRTEDTIEIQIPIDPHKDSQICMNVYNGYDLYTTSNMVLLPAVLQDEDETDLLEDEGLNKEQLYEGADDNNTEDEAAVLSNSNGVLSEKEYRDISYNIQSEQPKVENSFYYIILVLCISLVLAMLIAMGLIFRGRKIRRRRRRR